MSTLSRRRFRPGRRHRRPGSGVVRAGGTGEAPADNPKTHGSSWLYLAGDNGLTEDMVLALQDLLAEGRLRAT